MTYGAFTPSEYAAFTRVRRARAPRSQAVLCATALIVSTTAGLWLLYARDATSPLVDTPSAPTRLVLPAAPPALLPAPVRRPAAMRLDPSFTAPTLTASSAPSSFAPTFAQSAPLRAGFQPRRPVEPVETVEMAEAAPEVAPVAPLPPLPQVSELVQTVPLPPARPALLPPADAVVPAPSGRRRMALQAPQPAAPGTPPDARGFFEKMFGTPTTPNAALAYATPEPTGPGLFGMARAVPDRYTAVYDIAAHTVTLPDGTRLEAHSGIGSNKDDPRSVAQHMRGATPPAVYDLTPREALFHGVAALRLNPVGGAPYGRLGLLAHTYMLGPHGDSNGCVVFRDYAVFRRAYDRGMIRRLVVVARN
jgi:hypothetical protein